MTTEKSTISAGEARAASRGQTSPYIRWFEDISNQDVPSVGGKNASLGEMIRTLKSKGVRVPDGFATTSQAYWEYVDTNQLRARIQEQLDQLSAGKRTLQEVGSSIRKMFTDAKFPEALSAAIVNSYREMGRRYSTNNVDVAVRSSATAEDLPEASFAGQQETYLNIHGEQALLDACQKCYASLFTDRAITYRDEKDIEHMQVALSIGVQKMVRSDKASAGVIFTLDTESGFPRVCLVTGSWGLGENVVQGTITPDQYTVFKPLLTQAGVRPILEKIKGTKELKRIYSESGGVEGTKNVETSDEERGAFVLNDDEILELGRWSVIIEDHYQRPMDIEWAKDGDTGELFIVQARPETVQSRKKATQLKTYTLQESGVRLVSGLAVGQAVATGKVNVIHDVKDITKFQEGSILVTVMTDPDWVPIMRKARGIVTDQGGRTCHAAIVSRELGIPAIVGTGNATEVLRDGQEITLSDAEGDTGYIYQGALKYTVEEVNLEDIPETRTPIMMNMGSPAEAMRWWQLPCKGIGLARMEFIINNIIKIHPMALVHLDQVKDENARKEIEQLTQGYSDKSQYFVDNLAYGIAKIAASQYPNPVIVRMSDFKTNEYANLIGGKQFEPTEDNPMLGWRGASRYYDPHYREGFALECRAMKKVREEIGMSNVVLMIPFCRTLEEAQKVLGVLDENNLKRGQNELKLYMMAEIPSNIILAEEFADYFDGFSIGSNDLTQLTLGVDRDSGILAPLFDERNPAVKKSIQMLIESAHKKGTKVGICGQAPSDFPDFAVFLVQNSIDSISVNPDSVVKVKRAIAEEEKQLGQK